MFSTSEVPRARPAPRPDRPSAAAGSLSLTLRCTGSTTVLTMVGRFDADGLRAVEGLIDRIGCTVTDHLVANVSALHHVDEPGVRMLVALDCYMRARGGRLTVVDARGQVERALRPTGLALRGATSPAGAGTGALARVPSRVPATHADAAG